MILNCQTKIEREVCLATFASADELITVSLESRRHVNCYGMNGKDGKGRIPGSK